jgi:uncharacterized protein (DUF362 family)
MTPIKPKVLIFKCPEYDVDRIAGIIQTGMEELDARPFGRTMLKPNAVMALPGIFPHAFTRAEFLEGTLRAAKALGASITELSVGERCGITIPTRFVFKKAGYLEVVRRMGAKIHYFDESPHEPVRLTRKESLRPVIFVPKPVTECDFLINLPKFKAHPWTRMTLGLKNYIGLQDDRHRLVDHNSFLEHKIADLQEVIRPGFVAIDAIIAGQKMMLTPTPFPLGAIVMGVNSCAVDAVACRMVHVDPKSVIHLRLASERGFGPIDLDSIDVGGDYPLHEIQEKTTGFEFCFERIDDYFKESKSVSCVVGRFPEDHSRDYCWGGCPGALQEAMHIFRAYHPDVDDRMRKIRYVVGEVEGPLDLQPDERVIFAGDCCRWEGTIDGERVRIEGDYKSKNAVDVFRPPTNDMLVKILSATLDSFRRRSSRWVHMTGCPVSVAKHLSYFSALGRIPDPNFDPRNVVPVNVAYWNMRAHRALNRLLTRRR